MPPLLAGSGAQLELTLVAWYYSATMKRLKQATVKKGKTHDRICLTLEHEDGVFQAWLDPEQAEQLAAAIFTYRFDLPVGAAGLNGLPVGTVVVRRPPEWKKPPEKVFISFSTTMPRELGPRPRDFIKFVKDDPAAIKKLEKADAAWLRKAKKMQEADETKYGRRASLFDVEKPKKR